MEGQVKELRRISWIPSNTSSWQGPLNSSLGSSAEYYLIGLSNFLSVFRIYSVTIFDLRFTACTRTCHSLHTMLTFSVIILYNVDKMHCTCTYVPWLWNYGVFKSLHSGSCHKRCTVIYLPKSQLWWPRVFHERRGETHRGKERGWDTSDWCCHTWLGVGMACVKGSRMHTYFLGDLTVNVCMCYYNYCIILYFCSATNQGDTIKSSIFLIWHM